MNRPTIVIRQPASGATAPIGIEIKAIFSSGPGYYPLAVSSLPGNAYIQNESTEEQVPATVTLVQGYTIAINPNEDLDGDTLYRIFIIGDPDLDDDVTEGVRDINGIAMAGAQTWTFTTEDVEVIPEEPDEEPEPAPSPSLTPLRVTRTKPISKTVNISNIDRVEIEFNKNLNYNTVIGPNIYITKTSNK